MSSMSFGRNALYGSLVILTKLEVRGEMTKLTQELAVKLEQGGTSVSGTQWQTEE